MARSLADPYNPGAYALLLRSGVAQNIRASLPDAMRKRHAELRRSAENLRRAGLISEEAYFNIREKIVRAEGAKLLRQTRTFHGLHSRRAWFANLRQNFPLGLSSHDIRMGKSAHA